MIITFQIFQAYYQPETKDEDILLNSFRHHLQTIQVIGLHHVRKK